MDFDLSDDLVDFLVSEGGQKWLKDHGLKMYIEGRKGCSEVNKYALRDDCKPFIFFNPRATGPHIHVEIA